MNRIYINIAVMGMVNEVLSNLLNRIKESNLYDNCDQINLIVNGDINLINVDLTDSKYKIWNKYKDTSLHEFPTLDLIWKHSQNEEFNVLYIHTKGVSRNHPYINDWTNYLSYFTINKWEDRVNELIENDCTGVDLKGNPDDIKSHPSTWGYGKAPKHYSGNFWWSKSSHINKLLNPMSWVPDTNWTRWRMMNEMWICQLTESKYYNAYISNVDHYQSPYPKELYEEN
jgi:hypothetical protein